jgi:hypothetical protein
LVWACTEKERKQNSQKVLYMNLETTRLRGRPSKMARGSVGGWKTSWWKRVEEKSI